jgi:hypothetical protein
MMKRLRSIVKRLRSLWRGEVLDLDAFSSSQIASKQWLVEKLEECLQSRYTPPEQGYTIWILGGWYSLTNFIMRVRAVVPIRMVRSFDIDPECQPLADRVNKLWEWQDWQFKAETCDVNKLTYAVGTPQVVINSSVEHMDTDQWYKNIPKGMLVVLQANNMPHHDHVRSYETSAELLEFFPMEECLYEGSMDFNYPQYKFKRHMIIGIK